MATLTYLRNFVLARADELLAGVASLDPESDNPLVPVPMLDEELKKAARYLLRKTTRDVALYAVKEGKAHADVTIIAGANGSAIIPLPSDFMRFVSFKLTKWDRAESSYISDTSRTYNKQVHQFLRGSNERPVVALIPYTESYDPGGGSQVPPINQALQVWPYEAPDTIASFAYVPVLLPENMPDEYEDALVWRALQTVLITLKQIEQANLAGERFKEAIDELNFGMRGDHSSDVNHKRK